MLDRLANLSEEAEPLASAEIVLVAVISDFDALHQLHHEVRPSSLRRATVMDLGDVGMVHQRQCLPLGFKAGNDASSVHAQLDDFEGDAPTHRLLLLGHIDNPATALAAFLEK